MIFAEEKLEYDKRRCCICYNSMYSLVNKRDYFIVVSGVILEKCYLK